MKSFELNLDEINKKNLFLTVALGDFKAKSQNQCKNDITLYKGSKLQILTCSHGLHQLINQPACLLDSCSSCIDLIFTSQPNLVMESGVQISLHRNCHNQLVFPNFDLSIYYPPPYKITTTSTTTEQMLTSSREQLTCLTGIRHYVSKIRTNKLLFSVTL